MSIKNAPFEVAVVGAGPAGIATVGKLVDAGVSPTDIAWIDPQFKTGDFGTVWRHVESNTDVKHFIKFYNACASFRYSNPERTSFIIDKLAPDLSCPLMLAAEPLRWITEHLRSQVQSLPDAVRKIAPHRDGWQLQLASETTRIAKKVVLAVGSEPKILDFPGIPIVPLTVALQPDLLGQAVTADDHVVVFGGAQSAKSVIGNLSKIKPRKTVLFYRSEHLFDRHMDNVDLSRVTPLKVSPWHLLEQMPTCTKVIHAIGFERRHIPISGLPTDYGYDVKTGEIAPGIFGIGIAFPEIMPYELGQVEYRVSAIWPFMKRLEKLIPRWL